VGDRLPGINWGMTEGAAGLDRFRAAAAADYFERLPQCWQAALSAS